MNTLKQKLDSQEEINVAVKEIFNYFKKEVSYSEVLETSTDAQVEFMMILDAFIATHEDGISLKNITNYIFEANRMMRLLRPFAKMIGQVYGNED